MKPALLRVHPMHCACLACWHAQPRWKRGLEASAGLALVTLLALATFATRGRRSARLLAGGLLGVIVVLAIAAAGGPSPLVLIGGRS